MAIITPYSDPSAHGKVTPGLAFKRLGNRVIFGANRRPKNKNTAAQQTQRDKLKQAIEKYKILNYEEKIFLKRRGSMLSKNANHLYTSSQLKGNDWSKEKGHVLQEVNNMVIYDPKQYDTNDILFELECILSQAYPDNINLYNRLESQDTGTVASEDGPDFDWVGTPSHPAGRFGNGAYSISLSNYLKAADNGHFFKDLFNKHITAMWFKTTYNVTNGKPTVGGNKDLFDWISTAGAPYANRQSLLFHSAIGLRFSRTVEGVTVHTTTQDPAITFLAGDLMFILVAYDQAGIDGASEKVQIWFGNESTITKVASSSTTIGLNTRDAVEYSLLVNTSHNRKLDGLVDNIYTTDLVNNTVIQELVTGRNIEKFNTPLGNTWDNENRFNPGEVVSLCPELRLKISNFSATDWRIPFYWNLAITWSNQSITERATQIRLPKTTVLSSEAIILYLSQDMSNYFDRLLYRLGATDNV